MSSKPDAFSQGGAIPPPAYEEVVASIPDIRNATSPSNEKGQAPSNTTASAPQLQEPPLSAIPNLKLEADSWKEDPPLVTAAYRGDTGLVQILLSQGALVNGRSYFGKSALYQAASRKHWETFSVLVAHPDITVDAASPSAQTVLYKIASQGNVEKAKLLLERGAKADARVLGTQTALYAAVVRGDVDMVLVLLEAGADPNAAVFGCISPLYDAVKRRREAMVNLLLAYNADVDSTYWGGETPFHKACAMGDTLTMKKLLQKGAKPDAKPLDGSTALCDAARANKLEVMKILLAAGAKVDLQKWGGETPLTAAIGKGNLDAVKLMLESAGGNGEKKRNWVSQGLTFIQKSVPTNSQLKIKSHLESLGE